MPPDEEIRAMRTDDPPNHLTSDRPVDALTRKLFQESCDSVVRVETALGKGSGFAAKTPGLIITDYHVIAGAREIKVRTHGGQLFPVEVVDSDKTADLALLKVIGRVPSSVLRPLPIGHEKTVRNGDRVFALGHPFGLENQYISDGEIRDFKPVERNLIDEMINKVDPENRKSYSPEIQAIRRRAMLHGYIKTEQGNSGGPLLDKEGNVVGVCDLGDNTKKFTSIFTPASSVSSLLDRTEPNYIYRHQYYCQSDLVNKYNKHLSRSPLETGSITAFGAVAAGLSIAKYRQFASQEMTIVHGLDGSRRVHLSDNALKGTMRIAPSLLALSGGAYGIYSDGTKLLEATTNRDLLKYSTATAGDTSMASGGALRLMSRPGSTRGKYAAALIGAGALLRAGSEFVPNRLFMTDERINDPEDRRPPFNFYSPDRKQEKLP